MIFIVMMRTAPLKNQMNQFLETSDPVNNQVYSTVAQTGEQPRPKGRKS